MNFYSSNEFLEACSEVYFKKHHTSIEHVEVAGHVFRMLVVDQKEIITRMRFLDYHEPVTEEFAAVTRRIGRLQNVACAIVECNDHHNHAFNPYGTAPFIDWTMFADFPSYWRFARRRSNRIRELDRLRRKFQRDVGALVFNPHDYGADVIDFAIKWKRFHLRHTGQRDYFARPENIEFFHTLKQKRSLIAATLRLCDPQGPLLAVLLGFRYAARRSNWILTFDRGNPTIRRFCVGKLLVSNALEESFDAGDTQYDFSIGSDSWKWDFATHTRLLTCAGHVPEHIKWMTTMKEHFRAAFSEHPRLLRATTRTVHLMRNLKML